LTIAKRILAAHAGKHRVETGEFVNVKVDLVMAHDLTAGIAIQEFHKTGSKKVFDPQKVVLVMDHYVPNKDVRCAEQNVGLRAFAREQGILFFPEGRGGIEHVILPEKGLVLPGQVVVGADSHTCTYGALGAFATGMGSTDIAVAMATGEIWMKVPPSIKFVYHGTLPQWINGKDLILHTIGRIGVDGALYAVMEFRGQAIAELSVDSRLAMANMAIEAGAKAGLFAVDAKTRNYLEARTAKPYQVFEPQPDDEYAQVIEFDVSALEPQVALPHLPENARPVSAVRNVTIDQAVIGSCTNGRLEDLRIAAQVLKGRKVHPHVRCIVIPGSQQVYLDAMREGLIETFVNAGVAVSTPTCGPCVGGYMGILAGGEKCIATTNRNFKGRMGSPQSDVYLSGPAVAAASAVTGRISHPKEVLE
jgi:3-isopropylmalate/(R)-2-methylmalate dehydratase large subunit